MDIGTTTCRAIALDVECVPRHDGKGTDLVDPRTLYISETELTPFVQGNIDDKKLALLLEKWKEETKTIPFHAGGVILTGLAARAANLAAVQTLLKSSFSSLIMITADDPRYESWLCFKGSVQRLSQREPEKTFLHMDIGGGTTNLSVGKNGEVLDTGSFFIGARHVRFADGKVSYASPFAVEIFKKLGTEDRGSFARFLCSQLESLVTTGTCWAPLVQAELRRALPSIDCLSFSGGISPWIYGEPSRPFGDLGEELALAMRESKILKTIPWVMPQELGLATVAGLALYGYSFSGRSIYLPTPSGLPLSGVPIVKSFETFSKSGIAVFLSLPADDIEGAAKALRERFEKEPRLMDHPVVLLIDRDVGKTLGNLITDWGKKPWPLFVLDQVPPPHGQFLHLGKEDRGTVPISYYGML